MKLGGADEQKKKFLEQILAGRATRQETQGNYEQAFSLYVDSVQKYLRLIPLIQDAALKDHLKAISSKLLNRAERIKSSRPHLSLRAPVRDRTSSEEQEAVLRRSQKINGLNFYPWPSSDSGATAGPSQQPQSVHRDVFFQGSCGWVSTAHMISSCRNALDWPQSNQP